LPSRRRTSNEPLGASVVRTPVNTARPFWTIVTRQRRPTRFWSTSASVSIRPSSSFAFSFALLAAEHVPATRTARSAPFADAVEANTAAPSAATRPIVDMSLSIGTPLVISTERPR
jgi:hypothetical protein